MHVVVMGCGRVGSRLARTLDTLGHSVGVVDRDPESFRRLGTGFAGSTVAGVGFDRDTLLEAGIDRAGAFAAVSSGDNSNVISARVARETFGIPRVAARIYDPGRAEVYERLGIPTVATVRWTVDRMMRALFPEPRTLWSDPTGTVEMLEVSPHPEWAGYEVAQVEVSTGARVSSLVRFGHGLLPTAATVVQEGDRIYLVVTDDVRDRALGVLSAAPDGAAAYRSRT